MDSAPANSTQGSIWKQICMCPMGNTGRIMRLFEIAEFQINLYIKLTRSRDCFQTFNLRPSVPLVHFHHRITLLRYANKRIANK